MADDAARLGNAGPGQPRHHLVRERPLVSCDHEHDVVVFANPAHDVGEEREPLARVERPHRKQERPVDAETRPECLDSVAIGRTEYRRDPFGDHADPRSVRSGETQHIAPGRLGDGDHGVGSLKQPQPEDARSPDPRIVARHDEGDEVVHRDDHRKPRSQRLAEFDGVIEIGARFAQRSRNEERVRNRLEGRMHDPDATAGRQHAGANLGGSSRPVARSRLTSGGSASSENPAMRPRA